MITALIRSVEISLVLGAIAIHITYCPFNKVEESFNTQAVHDIVNIFPNSLPSTSTRNNSSDASQEISIRSHLPWDHTQYPGVVPRTFVGALLVGLPLRVAKYFIYKAYLIDGDVVKDEHDLTAQFLLHVASRYAVSAFAVVSLVDITSAIQRRYGLAYRVCFVVLTISQFHYMYYASRFLPNTFAASLANFAFAAWIGRRYSMSIIYIAICVLIFRFDTALFFGWLLLDGVFIRRFLSLQRVLTIGIPAGLVAIMITFIVDSIFWARPVWPELEGLYFNVWLNKSHEWGTQPYFWYIYSCMPRMMLAGAPLLLLTEHKMTRDYLIPVLAFIFTYSLLPHKELRFILFTVPLLNLCAASGLVNIYYYLDKVFVSLSRRVNNNNNQLAATSRSPTTKRSAAPKSRAKSEQNRQRHSRIALALFALVIVGLFSSNLFASFILNRISSYNYPGGEAALSLGVTKELLNTAKRSLDEPAGVEDLRSNVAVYVDNLAAQTGVSRFVQVDGVYYAKSPKIDARTFIKGYKLIYLILEPAEVRELLDAHCPADRNSHKVLEREPEAWRLANDEIKCTLPNQPEMYCSIIDTIQSFKSVNIVGLLRKLRQVNSIKTLQGAFDDANFIKTRGALHILRCSGRSKFNPFS